MKGDPLALAMYSVSVTLMIVSLQYLSVTQIWFADRNATACWRHPPWLS